MDFLAGCTLLTLVAQTTAIVVAGGDEVAARAARHVADHLEPAPEIRTASSAAAIEAWVHAAREPLVVAIDGAAAKVSVLRTSDGTVLSRAFEPGEDSAYAAALVALELIDIARVREERPPPPPAGVTLGVALDASLSVALSPGHERAVAQPTFGAALVVRGADGTWFGSAGAQARVLGDLHDTYADAVFGDALVDYERFDVALRAALGLVFGAFEPAVAIELGVSGSEVSVEDAGGAAVARDQRFQPWLAAGLDARFRLGAGFALRAGASAGTILRPARYLVRGDVAIEEGTFRLLLDSGLTWESP